MSWTILEPIIMPFMVPKYLTLYQLTRLVQTSKKLYELVQPFLIKSGGMFDFFTTWKFSDYSRSFVFGLFIDYNLKYYQDLLKFKRLKRNMLEYKM